MNYVAGIDPSLTSTGVVVLDLSGKLVLTKPIQSTRKAEARLIDLRDTLTSIVSTYKPTCIAIEGYAYGSKFGREQAGELGGILRVLLYEANRTYYVVQPTQLKQYAGLKGNAPKEDIKVAVLDKWGEKFSGHTNDESDAYVLSRIALAIHQYASKEKPELLDYEERIVYNILRGGKKSDK